jgi:RNA polymerase sigma factor (sigma-70 family)
MDLMQAAPPPSPEQPGGPAEAFTDAYRSLWPGLVRLGHLLAGSRAIGEEIAQEAFIGLLRLGSSVDNPGGYLRRSVVNLAISARKRQSRERAFVAGLREPVQLPPEIDHAWQLLSQLPARQRAVLVLRFYEDLTEAEVADVLGCRVGTVKSLASRGRAALKAEYTS